MNNFTKEELEDIKYLIDDYESHYGEYGRIGLGDKVRAMINNYSEPKYFKCKYCGGLRTPVAPDLFCCGEYEHE